MEINLNKQTGKQTHRQTGRGQKPLLGAELLLYPKTRVRIGHYVSFFLVEGWDPVEDRLKGVMFLKDPITV